MIQDLESMSYQLNNDTEMTEEFQEAFWTEHCQTLTSEQEEFELDSSILDDLLKTFSPSTLFESELLDDISNNQSDCILNNEDQSINDFISSVNMQLDLVSNESDCSYVDSFPLKDNEISELTKLDSLYQNDCHFIINNATPKTYLKRNSSNEFKKKLNTTIERVDKKQSNKEAAIRYRQKKMKEKYDLFKTRDGLKSENEDLKKKIEDIQLEISLVKNILVELLIKKN
jgi:hypothetical protein